MTVLLFDWEGEDVRELLAVPVHVSLTNLHLNLSGDIVTTLCWLPVAHHSFRTIAIVLCALVPLAVELHGVGAGDVIDNLFLHVAVRSLQVSALVVILGGHVYLVRGVAHPVLASEAPLHLVGLLERLVVNSLDQVKTDALNVGFYDTRTVPEWLGDTGLLVLGK